jgi:hypothetical protein
MGLHMFFHIDMDKNKSHANNRYMFSIALIKGHNKKNRDQNKGQ